MATVLSGTSTHGTPPDGQRFVLYNLGWHGYQQMLHLVGDRPIRLTYDRGNLELMSPLARHERYKQLLGRAVEIITEELDIPMIAAGSTTFHRVDLDRGLEPDQCYYFANAARIQNRDRIDLRIDPPPDLAIEVDITSSSLDRLAIYAALGVPEVWRFDGEALVVLLLQPDGRYTPSETSAALPFVPMPELAHRLLAYDLANDSRWSRELRTWVREEIVPKLLGPGH